MVIKNIAFPMTAVPNTGDVTVMLLETAVLRIRRRIHGVVSEISRDMASYWESFEREFEASSFGSWIGRTHRITALRARLQVRVCV